MPSQRIMLIRHAEKPKGAWPGPGLDENGSKDKDSLVIRGWQRAGALAAFFRAPQAPLATPARIYASDPLKVDDTGSKSKRPLQTITPLAAVLPLEVITRYVKGQEQALSQELAVTTGDTLVCWQHESIPPIAGALLGDDRPLSWPDDRFDLVWVLQRAEQTDAWTFTEVRQGLLVGDLPA